MQLRTRNACLSAAVAAALYGIPAYGQARDLVWDYNGTNAPVAADGSGSWDTANQNWVISNATGDPTGANTAFQNGDNVTFGSQIEDPAGTGVGPHNVDITTAVAPNNIRLENAESTAVPPPPPANQDPIRTFYNFSGGTLTLTGNLIKEASRGGTTFNNESFVLGGTGSRLIGMRDTPGDIAEIAINSALSGSAGLTVDNTGLGGVNGVEEGFGTLAINGLDNTGYTGVTTINRGRIVISTSGALGSTAAGSGTIIGPTGTLAIYGAGTRLNGDLTLTEPITITRSQYAEAGGEFERNNGAIQSNDANNTINGPLTLNTTDARFQVNGGSLTVNSTLTDGSAGATVVSKTGGALLTLTGNNTFTGGNRIIGGTLAFDDLQALGGPTAKVFFDGGFLRVLPSMPNFGSLQVDFAEFSGGIDVPDAAQVFTIAQNLTGGNFNKRGLGTVNLNGTNTFANASFTDLGTVNINGSTTTGGIRIRNGTVVVNTGGTLASSAGNFSSIGVDGGENGTLIVRGGTLTSGTGDFNVSDNPGSRGTFTLESGTATIGGPFLVAKNENTTATASVQAGTLTVAGAFRMGIGRNSTATVTQSGGTINANKPGQESFEIGRGTGVANNVQTGGTATVTKTGGNLNVTGEMWVGNEPGGRGTFTQSAGATTVNDWMVVGRFSSLGTMTLSGNSTMTKRGGGETEWDVDGGAASTVTLSNTAQYIAETGDIRLGHRNAGADGTLVVRDSAAIRMLQAGGDLWIGSENAANVGRATFQDNASLEVNSEVIIGRANATGFLTVAGNATVLKTGGGVFQLGQGAAGNGTVTQTGGRVTNTTSETWIANEGNGLYNLSGGSLNTALIHVGFNGGADRTAELRISNTGVVNATQIQLNRQGTVASTVNLSGGTLAVDLVRAGDSGGTGPKNFNFTGGRLNVTNFQLGTDLRNEGTGRLAPGARESAPGVVAAGLNSIGTTTIGRAEQPATGTEPAVPAIAGGYIQNGGGVLEIEIAAADSFDRVFTNGPSTINGSVFVDLLGSYSPNEGQVFDVLVANATTLIGSPVLTGPDAGRFSASIIDGPSDDRLRLTANAVPEPTALALLGIVGTGLLGRRRRTSRRSKAS